MLKEKDVLEYTKDELEELSVSELEELLKECEDGQSLYHTQQMAKKILINSLYGALSNKNFLLFNEEIGQAITGNGRYFIQKVADNVENKLQSIVHSTKPYVIAGDTDSFYFQIKPIMDIIIQKNPDKTLNDYVDMADKFENNIIQPVVQNTIKDFAQELNAHDISAIAMKREAIADKCCFVAKKKYFARVLDSEGVRYPTDAPHMKVMGLEIARSNTPVWAKKKLKESLNIILDKNEADLQRWIEDLRDEFLNVPIEQICMFGSVSSVSYKIGDKAIPWMCKGGIYYNKYIYKRNLTHKFAEIKGGDKVKLLFLKMPNDVGNEVIAYNDDNFVEYIKKYIDYDVCFEKGFLNPLNNMINVLGYDIFSNVVKIDEW